MESEPFLTIDEQPVSLRQALSYLRAIGDLQPFILKILRQHLIEQELQSRPDLEVDPLRLDQLIMDFRLQNKLINPQDFEQWLQTQDMSYDEFRHQIAAGLKIDQLKAEVTAPKLEDAFNQNKELLNQVILSRIVVAEKDLAENLKNQILEDSDRFEPLVRAHSLTDDRIVNGVMGSITLGELPPRIQEALVGANPGELIGPVEFEGRYCLLRVEQILPASLEGSLKRQLQEQLFEQWLAEKAQKMTIKMHVD